MPSYAQDVPLYVNGVESSLLAETNPRVRAATCSRDCRRMNCFAAPTRR
jgi:hypothetical protein